MGIAGKMVAGEGGGQPPMWQADGRQIRVNGRQMHVDGGKVAADGGQMHADGGQTAAYTAWWAGGRQMGGQN